MWDHTCLTICSFVGVFFLNEAFENGTERRCTEKSPKWRDFGGDFCYLIETHRAVPWIDAAYHCFLYGGNLASFHSASEVEAVITQITDKNIALYIGLWKHYDGSLEWVDQSPVDFRNWSPGEPGMRKEKCVEIYTNYGKWNDIFCTSARGYICSSPKVSSRDTMLHPQLSKVCPEKSMDWLDLGGEYCYIVENVRKTTWTEVLGRCAEKGGTLASIHNIGELSALLQRTKDNDERLHIGLRQNDFGHFRWVDGSPMDFDNWESALPYNKQKICGQMNGKTGHWSDTNCQQNSGYICSAIKGPCGRDIRSDNGSFHSPMYPGFYRPLENCLWKITVPEGYQVALHFKSFDVDYNINCEYDYVKVIDGHNESDSPITDVFCGQYLTEIFHSSKNKMAVQFVTDTSGQRPGFSAEFVKVPYCGENITADNGTFRYPVSENKYGPGQKCIWKITVPENHRVSLKFTTFDIQYDSHCASDFIEVRDGHESSSPVLGKLCGSNVPGIIRSFGNKMTVQFESDFDIEKGGFTAEFEKDICGGYIFSEMAYLSSPNYPQKYRPYERCTWKITVPEKHRVALQFLTFELEGHGTKICLHDFVEIRDGHELDSSLLGKFCGKNVSEIVRSSTNTMSVTFESDQSFEYQGFLVKFAKAKFCGGVVEADNGVLLSPNYPNNYGPGEECVWKIRVPPHLRISLKFRTFEVDFSDNCTEDFLEVHDGNETSPVLTKTCGSTIPADIISSGNTMTVVFATDISNEKTGFSAEFTAKCGEDFYSDRGIISSPGYPGNYQNNLKCIWKITVPENHQVFLQFHSQDVEYGAGCMYDYIEIRDGHEEDSAVLALLCGEAQPNPITSTGNTMSIIFESDNAVRKQGFAASFEKVMTPEGRLIYAVQKFPALLVQHHLPKVKENVLHKHRQRVGGLANSD